VEWIIGVSSVFVENRADTNCPSDIRPAEGVDSRPVPRLAGCFVRPVWFYLLVCAWCLTSWEWFLYQRRWID